MKFTVFLAIAAKSIIYGLSIFFTGTLTRTTDTLDILAIRYIITFFTFYILKVLKIVKIKVSCKEFFQKTKQERNIKTLLLACVFEPVLYMIFETTGISMTTGITAGVILALAPIFSCIFETVILKERSTFVQKLFLAVGILGVVYIAINTNTSDGQNSIMGIFFMFATVISGVLFSVFVRKSTTDFSSLEIAYVMSIFGMVVFNTINVIRHISLGDIKNYFAPILQSENLMAFIYLSIISCILATCLGNYAYSKSQISSLAAFGGLSTLVTIAVGAIINGERIYSYHIVGIVLIFTRIIGVTVIDVKNKKQN